MLANLQYQVLSLIMRLPRPLLARVAGPTIITGGQPLDLHCQAMLRLMEFSGQPTLEEAGAVRGRRYMDARAPALSGAPRLPNLARLTSGWCIP
jgi:hypothetical protein